jgi:glycosyltransferase involved in cell wall biosynthesis
VDVDSGKWAALARTERVPQRWVYSREASSVARFETIAIRRAHATLVVNECERANALRLAPDGRVLVVPNGIDHDAFRPRMPPATEPRVVFCGVMNYRPNEEAALWLGREVWPLVRRVRSDARLLLLGSKPTRAIRALASSDPTVEVSGSVPDVRPHLWRSALAVAPLFVAPGIQNKVLESTAAGLPSIVTPDVFKGLPAEVVPACSVVSSAPNFAEAILKMLDLSPAERRRIADRADLDSLGWRDRLAPFLPIVDAAAQAGPNQRGVEEHMKYSITVPGYCEHGSVAKP